MILRMSLLLMLSGAALCQINTNENKPGGLSKPLPFKEYSFLIMDNPHQLYSMRQYNKNYLNTLRLVVRRSSERLGSLRTNILQFIGGLFLAPLTHEEGHRSVLTHLDIGSISKPYFNEKGAAYVMGVRDSDLINLRNNDLPNYIRLHTAGIESDYMLLDRIQTDFVFNKEDKKHLFIEHLFRQSQLIGYYATSMLPSMEPDIDEEPNELQRDIVGHDVYGAIRHLHRPAMEFYRYTRYDNLTKDEKAFVSRVGYRSLVNLVDPFIFRMFNRSLNDLFKVSMGMGYTMVPFGDFIEQKFWITIHDKTRLKLYVREYQNKEDWFLAGGIALHDHSLSDRLYLNTALHVWDQPVVLSFTDAQSEMGGALNTILKYVISREEDGQSDILSLDLGLLVKSAGFLPEELYLGDVVHYRFGTTVWF